MSDTVPASTTMIVHDLTLQLEEAQGALRAIRSGEVDALVVAAGSEQQVFILKGADHAHRVLLEALNEGVMTIAPDATILSANRRFAELLGRPLEKILGVSLLPFIAPGGADVFAALLERATLGGSKGELRLVADGGVHVPVLASLSTIGEGVDRVYTVVVSDLTQLKEAQSALEKSKDELEARVLARTSELAKANEALRAEIAARTRLEGELRRKAEELIEADQRKDEFLSMLAHELRNPLAPILTASEMLRFVAAENPKVERYRSVIERQVRNLTRLVDDLLDVSRITRRRVTLQPEPIELSTIVASAVEASRPLIDARGHHLAVSLPADPARIHVDPTRFEQVLVNLLNNAAKYTERGGQIRLSTSVRDGQVTIRVRDSGVGIPVDLLPRVFDLFVQGERSLDRSQGGLGIGLTLVKSLIEMHGGQIEAHSEGAGMGSEFVIHLPLAASSGDEAAESHGDPGDGAEEESCQPSGPRRRVLVVEDNADAIATLIELIALWGHEVLPARDGEEALRLAAAFAPDVVLIDIGLPGMDGYEIARRLRSLDGEPGSGAKRARPLVVAVTGYGQASDQSLGIAAGFDHHLVKPPDPDVLRALLARGRDGLAGVARATL